MKTATQLQCWALGGLAVALLAMAGWSQGTDKEAPIRLTVKVPDPNAMLYVDNNLTRQKGEMRYFESPPVPTGKKYSYALKVTWMEGGKEMTRSRKVRVEPGKENNIDLTKEETKTPKDKGTKKDTQDKGTKKGTQDKGTTKDAKDKEVKDKDLLPPQKKDKEATDAIKDKDKVEKKNGNKSNPDDKGASAPRSREFLFTYAATVTGLRPGQAARVWVPVPPSNEDQRVQAVPRPQPFRG
jgi:uncharacterized protein (TIGR03000 family)